MLDFGFYNMDCMEGMKQFPDKYFDLAIVDPPYGGGSPEYDAQKQRYGGHFQRYAKENVKVERTGRQWAEKYGKKIASWDVAPSNEYFEELFRVSKNQIIWGGNYFELPPTRCFVIWKKLTITENFSMAMAEYGWTSFNDNSKIFECAPQGTKNEVRFHPTQKPIALYEWLLKRYAKPGDIILDTHVGSASSLIACHRTHHKFVGFELDGDYFKKANERLKQEQAQLDIFDCFGFDPYQE